MASKGTNTFKLHTFCLITGASKGLGRCMSWVFGRRFPKDSVLVLIARNKEKLEETAALVRSHAPHLRIKLIPLDLSQQDEHSFEKTLKGVFHDLKIEPQDFDQALIIHNAGSMGASRRMIEYGETKLLKDYFDLNVTSVVILNTIFLRLFSEEKVKHRLVINLSSICALQPFKTWSLYCSGKAARDMFFRTMALEDPNIRVLNYAPGPIDTDMQFHARTFTKDEEVKALFTDMHAKGKLLKCEQSIGRLEKVLETNTFDSGAHIDYYDLQ